jgi:CSLREA domain-containing protein
MKRRLIGIVVVLNLMMIVVATATNFGFRIEGRGAWTTEPGAQNAMRQAPGSLLFDPHPAIRDSQSVLATEQGRPWVNLLDGFDLPTVYRGAPGLTQAFSHGLTMPTALASADFDEDGMPDLVAGHIGPGGGILTLHRGNIELLWPRGSLQPATGNRQLTMDTLPFLPEARVFAVAAAPDFLGAGDFDADGHQDVVAAAHGGNVLMWLPGDGRGRFGETQTLLLPGSVTALAVGEINRRDSLSDVVVGIADSESAQVLIFESSEGALQGPPEVIALPTQATALALGQLDESFEDDLAIAAATELLLVHGRGRSSADCSPGRAIADLEDRCRPQMERVSLPFPLLSLALGDFVADSKHRPDIALLGSDGTLHFVEQTKGSSWGLNSLELEIPKLKSGPQNPQSAIALIRANVSSLPTDDLIVVDQNNHQLHILAPDDGRRTTDLGPSAIGRSAILSAAGSPVAVLPMRLNVDALTDLVILRKGSTEPAVVLTAAAATFIVNSTADTDDGVCTTSSGGCTLREAINAANENAGADTIEFNIGSGTPSITLGRSLPVIIEPVTINGNTGGATRVELNGNHVVVDGLIISAGNSVVRNLVIKRCVDDAIEVHTNGSNILEGNFIGPDSEGTSALGNGTGVEINSEPSNTIGGTVAAARNLISGNKNSGVTIVGEFARSNRVQGNFIGTDVTGTVGLGNGTGVHISDAGSNTIGGATPTPGTGLGNLISGNGVGVRIVGNGADGNTVVGNLIGTQANGTTALANGSGVSVASSADNTTVGGTTSTLRNVISGNVSRGVEFVDTGTSANLVQGNYIGTDITGSADLGNGGTGVYMANAPSNTIGGAVAAARNLISGNNRHGVEFLGSGATGNQVQGNFIGTDVTGTVDLGNAGTGVYLNATAANTIGGTAPGAGNLISGNNSHGVEIITGLGGSQVQGNFIGTDITGTVDLGNAGNGVFLYSAHSHTIGGTVAAARNLISGNDGDGVTLYSFGSQLNQVQGNFIGTTINGMDALGNSWHGVSVLATANNNTIGGTAMGSGNTIAFNGLDGVFVESEMGNRIESNSIFSNGGLGIDLSPDGVTANDPGDPDLGANNGQNFPVLTVVMISNAGDLMVEYSVDSTTSDSAYDLRIEFFEADSAASGEGRRFLGVDTYPAAQAQGARIVSLGNAASLGVVMGDSIVVTATDANGNTSEFSAVATATSPTRIIVNKDVVPNDSSQWQINVTGQSSQTIGDGGQAAFSNLSPGQYTVSESGSSGYTSAVNCGGKGSASGTSITFTLNAGESVTCTFTNSKNGTIIVEKQTEPDGDPQTFSFSGTASGIIGDGQQITVNNLAPGKYTSTETVPSGWTLTSIVCDDANSAGNLTTKTATFTLDPGETVTCTFTNAKVTTGSITIVKDAVPNDPQDFAFTGSGPGGFNFSGGFSLDDDGNGTLPNSRTFSNLSSGIYMVAEAAATGWNLTGLVCADPDNGTTVSLSTRQATIDLDVGETITCTFTNTKTNGGGGGGGNGTLFTLQGNGVCLTLNLQTRQYIFKDGRRTIAGIFTYRQTGQTIRFQSAYGDQNRLSGSINLSTRTADATLTLPLSLGGQRYTINDANISNNASCM